jgi:hypothetical protein
LTNTEQLYYISPTNLLNMKCFFAVIVALLFAGCAKNTQIDFTGTTPGINTGTFMIRDIRKDSIICQADIKSGKFDVSRKLNYPGYYYMLITKPGIGTMGYDVYLEAGQYTVITNRDKPYKYPDIQSTSKKQNELSAYYHLCDTVNDAIHKKVHDLSARIDTLKKSAAPANSYIDVINQLKAAQQQESEPGLIALSAFVDKYPDNEIAPRLMLLNNAYQADPRAYYKIYQKLGTATKNSSSGKELQYWLSQSIPVNSK